MSASACSMAMEMEAGIESNIGNSFVATCVKKAPPSAPRCIQASAHS
jgi:hypothetical protein